MIAELPKDLKTLSDEALMQMIAHGNKPALEELYDRYFNRLVWFARGYLAGAQLAEDAVQEVFIKLIEKPDLFDADKKFSTWVYTITANHCKQQLRNAKNRLRILQENSNPMQNATNQENLDQKFLRQRLSEIYQNLEPKEKNIFTLRFDQDMSIKEIASVLQIPEGSVKSGLFYLLKKFAKNLKQFKND